jgi:hypothetical protein
MRFFTRNSSSRLRLRRKMESQRERLVLGSSITILRRNNLKKSNFKNQRRLKNSITNSRCLFNIGLVLLLEALMLYMGYQSINE